MRVGLGWLLVFATRASARPRFLKCGVRRRHANGAATAGCPQFVVLVSINVCSIALRALSPAWHSMAHTVFLGAGEDGITCLMWVLRAVVFFGNASLGFDARAVRAPGGAPGKGPRAPLYVRGGGEAVGAVPRGDNILFNYSYM